MAMTKNAAIEKAIVDAECYGYVKPGTWRSLKASGVTAREPFDRRAETITAELCAAKCAVRG